MRRYEVRFGYFSGLKEEARSIYNDVNDRASICPSWTESENDNVLRINIQYFIGLLDVNSFHSSHVLKTLPEPIKQQLAVENRLKIR